ncbi:MAG: hypothetical protein ACYTGF_18350 [Planctomycetota bacterium]|jgi:hypothetical protein
MIMAECLREMLVVAQQQREHRNDHDGAADADQAADDAGGQAQCKQDPQLRPGHGRSVPALRSDAGLSAVRGADRTRLPGAGKYARLKCR